MVYHSELKQNCLRMFNNEPVP